MTFIREGTASNLGRYTVLSSYVAGFRYSHSNFRMVSQVTRRNALHKRLILCDLHLQQRACGQTGTCGSFVSLIIYRSVSGNIGCCHMWSASRTEYNVPVSTQLSTLTITFVALLFLLLVRMLMRPWVWEAMIQRRNKPFLLLPCLEQTKWTYKANVNMHSNWDKYNIPMLFSFLEIFRVCSFLYPGADPHNARHFFRTTEAFSEKRISRTKDILRGQGQSWRHQPWP